MTDQLKIDAMNNESMINRPDSVDSWKAKSKPSAARKLGSSGTMNLNAHSKSTIATGKILAVVWVTWTTNPAAAAEGAAYDVFGRALSPIAASLFAGTNSAAPAMVAEGQVIDGSGPLAAAKDTRFRVAWQSPDRVRVDVVRGGTKITACREGDEIWAAPAETVRPLLQAAGLATTNPPATETSAIPPSPGIYPGIDPQMLAFLPALFDVQDQGTDQNLRVLDFTVLPQLQQMIPIPNFRGRAWIGSNDRPQRLSLAAAGETIDIRIDQLEFPQKLSAGAWQPAANEDALRLPAANFDALLGALLGNN